MKLVFKLTLLILFVTSCKAQSPVVSLDAIGDYEDTNGIYYKDIDGDLDKYVGTWKYTNGTTSLTITFKKVIQYYNGEWYADKLVGDYKYVKNGVVILDYLSRVNSPTVNDAQHYIDGYLIIYPKQFVKCDTCAHLERRIKLFFDDPERYYLANAMAIRHVNVNGVEKIEMNLRDSDTIVLPEGAEPQPRVPYGDYTLIKQ